MHLDDGSGGAGQHHQRRDGPGTGALRGGAVPVPRHAAAKADRRADRRQGRPAGDELRECELVWFECMLCGCLH